MLMEKGSLKLSSVWYLLFTLRHPGIMRALQGHEYSNITGSAKEQTTRTKMAQYYEGGGTGQVKRMAPEIIEATSEPQCNHDKCEVPNVGRSI